VKHIATAVLLASVIAVHPGAESHACTRSFTSRFVDELD